MIQFLETLSIQDSQLKYYNFYILNNKLLKLGNISYLIKLFMLKFCHVVIVHKFSLLEELNPIIKIINQILVEWWI